MAIHVSRARLKLGAFVLALAMTACQQPAAPQVPAGSASGATTPTPVAASVATPVELDAGQRTMERTSFSKCNLETYDGQEIGNEVRYVSGDKSKVTLGGWLASSLGAGISNSPGFLLKMNERVWSSPIQYNVERVDVANSYNDQSLQRAGFTSVLDLSGMPSGVYHVLLNDGPGTSCDNGRYLRI